LGSRPFTIQSSGLAFFIDKLMRISGFAAKGYSRARRGARLGFDGEAVAQDGILWYYNLERWPESLTRAW